MSKIGFNPIKIKSFSKIKTYDDTLPSLKYVVLEPAGFPIRVSSENVKVSTDDPILFNIYARLLKREITYLITQSFQIMLSRLFQLIQKREE